MKLVIGTRGSLLARTQSQWVRDQLGVGELKIITTRGDRLVDLPLQSNLEKGLFTKELEVALLDGDIDLAVHSLKDLPVQPPAGLVVSSTPVRAPVADLLIWRRGEDVDKPGLRVGTSSARRIALLNAYFPSHHAVPLRGNVPTRLKKLERGDADAIILAEAGIHRLGLKLEGFDVQRLNPTQWIPAPGQGALGLEHRAQDPKTEQLLQTIRHQPTIQAVQLERAILEHFGGGCHAAIGAFAIHKTTGWKLYIGARHSSGAFKISCMHLDEPALDDVSGAIRYFDEHAQGLQQLERTPWSA